MGWKARAKISQSDSSLFYGIHLLHALFALARKVRKCSVEWSKVAKAVTKGGGCTLSEGVGPHCPFISHHHYFQYPPLHSSHHPLLGEIHLRILSFSAPLNTTLSQTIVSSATPGAKHDKESRGQRAWGRATPVYCRFLSPQWSHWRKKLFHISSRISSYTSTHQRISERGKNMADDAAVNDDNNTAQSFLFYTFI